MRIPLSMLAHSKTRLLVTLAGVAIAFSLAVAQAGLYRGWCYVTSAIVRHADVDLWVIAPNTPSFDYPYPMPDERVHQARAVAGVASAESMIVDWALWRGVSGNRASVQMVGLDDRLYGRPWSYEMGQGECIFRPETVAIDALYLDEMGVRDIGDEAVILGQGVRVGAITSGVRTFTAAPYVFSSLETARQCVSRYDEDTVSYVLIKCHKQYDVAAVQRGLINALPDVSVLTTNDFADRTTRYWMTQTGAGATVLLTACLGIVVAIVIVSQTLFAITQDHLDDYATLLALGYSRASLTLQVLVQAIFLGFAGSSVGTTIILPLAYLSRWTSTPLDVSPSLLGAMTGITMVSSSMAAILAINSLRRIDPIEAFSR